MQLKLSSLSKYYTVKGNRKAAFESLDLEVEEGEFVALVGPSGCGKTTLLRVVAGLESASNGSMEGGSEKQQNISMVFQEHGLFPWMSLRKNIEVVLKNNPTIVAAEIPNIVDHFFGKIDLLDYQNYYPHQVSGGMRQRVNVARSFANRPDLLLMDEPFVFLDYQTRFALHELLLQIWQEARHTVLFVTHDIEEAVLLADRVVLMSASPGKIVKSYPISLPRPRDIWEVRQQPEFYEPVNEILNFIKQQQTGKAVNH